jgi:hypothetical protein
MHEYALQVLPEVLSRAGVMCLFEINESSAHAARSTKQDRNRTVCWGLFLKPCTSLGKKSAEHCTTDIQTRTT